MDTNDSGELIDYDDANALDMFHEDAMRQVREVEETKRKRFTKGFACTLKKLSDFL